MDLLNTIDGLNSSVICMDLSLDDTFLIIGRNLKTLNSASPIHSRVNQY